MKQEAQEVLEQGEHLLAEANQLSDNINKEAEVHKHSSASALLFSLVFICFFAFMPSK